MTWATAVVPPTAFVSWGRAFGFEPEKPKSRWSPSAAVSAPEAVKVGLPGGIAMSIIPVVGPGPLNDPAMETVARIPPDGLVAAVVVRVPEPCDGRARADGGAALSTVRVSRG